MLVIDSTLIDSQNCFTSFRPWVLLPIKAVLDANLNFSLLAWMEDAALCDWTISIN